MLTGPCIEWTGARTSKGYGIVHVRGTTTTAHRKAYIDAFGPIPDDLQVDHLCRNTGCVNPAHLELVTPSENLRRRPITERTHCPHGHELTEENTYVQVLKGHPVRSCREGRNRRSRGIGVGRVPESSHYQPIPENLGYLQFEVASEASSRGPAGRLLVQVGASYCTAHHGLAEEDMITCDFREEPEECVLRPLYVEQSDVLIGTVR